MHHRRAMFVELRFLIPPVKSVCNCKRPSSSANAMLLRYPAPDPWPLPAMPAPLFFESSENAFGMTGMLRRRIHPPLGFSGRSWMSGSGGRRSRGEGAPSRDLYFDAEHVSQPQYGAWSVGCDAGDEG